MESFEELYYGDCYQFWDKDLIFCTECLQYYQSSRCSVCVSTHINFNGICYEQTEKSIGLCFIKEGATFCTSCAYSFNLTADNYCVGVKTTPTFVWAIIGILLFVALVAVIFVLVMCYYKKKNFLRYQYSLRKIKLLVASVGKIFLMIIIA